MRRVGESYFFPEFIANVLGGFQDFTVSAEISILAQDGWDGRFGNAQLVYFAKSRERPIAAFHHHLKILRCGPSERPFAATLKALVISA
jgi:hypothetical protein